MALPTSGPISLLDIQNEHGGSNPISIDEYYGVDTGVPSSGTISFDDFYGTSSFTVQFDKATYEAEGEDFSGPVSVSITVNNTGTIVASGNTLQIGGEWTPESKVSGNGNNYDVRLTGSGTTPSGSAINSWLSLSSNRTWSLEASFSTVIFNGTIEIRDSTTLSVLDSASFILDAEILI